MKAPPGTRTCKTCKRELPASDFAKVKSGGRSRRCRHCKRRMTFNVKRWHKHGRECSRCGETRPCPDQITDFPWREIAICQPCIDAKARARTSEWARWKRRVDPEWRRRQIDAMLKWQAKHPEQVREINKRRYERAKSDPVRRERIRENARMNYRMNRERIGKPPKPLTAEVYERLYGAGFGRSKTVPIEPLASMLKQAIEDIDRHSLADVSGVSERRIYDIVNDKQNRISLVHADRFCVYFDVPFKVLYPDI